MCPLTISEGALNLLQKVDDDAGIYSDCSTRKINNRAGAIMAAYHTPNPIQGTKWARGTTEGEYETGRGKETK